MFDVENPSVIRKQVLLRLCVRLIASSLKLEISPDDVQEVSDSFRLRYDLADPQRMAEWMQREGVTEAMFLRAMMDSALAYKIDRVWDTEISREVDDHIRVTSARQRQAPEPAGQKEAPPAAGWVQMNIALTRQHGEALPAARALFDRLSPALADWRGEGAVQCFFFMRKPPDLRLRFLARDPAACPLPQLETMLSRLAAEGAVARYFPSVYEPETFQFGGLEAMEHVHQYFDADSEAWIAFDRLAAAGRRSISTQRLVLAVTNDLFLRTLGGHEEVWDTWCNLASLLSSSQAPALPAEPLVLIDTLLPDASTEERDILHGYLRANRRLAAGLLQVWNAGRLRCGLRAILPFVATFQANRHGLAAPAQAALASAMTEAWNPKRGLRGVEAEPPLRAAG